MNTYCHHEVKALLRLERRRVRFDAAVSLVLTLGAGFVYAQLARKMGAPSPWIGLIAIGAQAATFACAMWAKISDVIWKRKPL